jgi:hypothetical protein
MSELPLHVRVAVALGWPPPEYITDEGHDPNRPIYGWRQCHREHDEYEDCYENHLWHCGTEDYFAAPRYDTDWSATGPLIEKYVDGLTFVLGNRGARELDPKAPEWDDHYDAVAFGGRLGRDLGGWFQRQGATPLLAICHLILALKEAGKL